MTDEPNGMSLSRRAQVRTAGGNYRMASLYSMALSDTMLDYLVHRHLRRSGKGFKAHDLSLAKFIELLRERYGLHVDQAPPDVAISSDSLARNRRFLERRLRDLGLLVGVNDAESMKRLRQRFEAEIDREDEGAQGINRPDRTGVWANHRNGGEGDVAYAGFLPSQTSTCYVRIVLLSTQVGASSVSPIAMTSLNVLLLADHAVELRERKADALLLLIDRERAGAGSTVFTVPHARLRKPEFLEAAVSLARASVGMASVASRGKQLGVHDSADGAISVSGGSSTSMWLSGQEPHPAQLSGPLRLWPIESERPAELLHRS